MNAEETAVGSAASQDQEDACRGRESVCSSDLVIDRRSAFLALVVHYRGDAARRRIRSCVLWSFRPTCQRLGAEPWADLQEVRTRLPATPAEKLGELLPYQWQAARPAKVSIPLAAAETGTPSADVGS
jgi:hypothetical protein